MKKDNFLFDAGVGDVNILPVVNMESIQKLDEKELPETLPILTLRNAVLFPSTVIPIAVGREKSIKLVRDAYKSGKILGAVAQLDNEVEHPTIIDLFDIGTLGRILKIIEMPDGSITAILQGVKRFKIVEQTASEPYLFAKVKYLNDILAKKGDKEMEALSENIKDLAMQIIKSSPHMPQEASFAIKNLEGHEFLTNFIASSMEIDDTFEKMRLLQENHVKVRAMRLLEILNRQMDILNLKNDIQQKVRT